MKIQTRQRLTPNTGVLRLLPVFTNSTLPDFKDIGEGKSDETIQSRKWYLVLTNWHSTKVAPVPGSYINVIKPIPTQSYSKSKGLTNQELPASTGRILIWGHRSHPTCPCASKPSPLALGRGLRAPAIWCCPTCGLLFVNSLAFQ